MALASGGGVTLRYDLNHGASFKEIWMGNLYQEVENEIKKAYKTHGFPTIDEQLFFDSDLLLVRRENNCVKLR
jgi:hypothetical protein